MADCSVRMQRVTAEVEKEQEGLGTALLKDANHSRCGGGGMGGDKLNGRGRSWMGGEEERSGWGRGRWMGGDGRGRRRWARVMSTLEQVLVLQLNKCPFFAGYSVSLLGKKLHRLLSLSRGRKRHSSLSRNLSSTAEQ